MKLLILLLFLTFSNSCTSVPIQKNFGNYRAEFSNVTGLDASWIPIYFKNKKRINEDTVNLGTCHFIRKEPELNYIIINKTEWVRISKIQKKAVVFHELMHCVGLMYGHTKGNKANSSCPKSIMDAVVASDYCLNTYWDYYMKDLKKRGKSVFRR